MLLAAEETGVKRHSTDWIDADDLFWHQSTVTDPLQIKVLVGSHQDVCHAFRYTLGNRPDGVIIPLGGLCELL